MAFWQSTLGQFLVPFQPFFFFFSSFSIEALVLRFFSPNAPDPLPIMGRPSDRFYSIYSLATERLIKPPYYHCKYQQIQGSCNVKLFLLYARNISDVFISKGGQVDLKVCALETSNRNNQRVFSTVVLIRSCKFSANQKAPSRCSFCPVMFQL